MLGFLRHSRSERGQALVLLAIGFMALAAFVGLAIDGWHWYREIDRARRAVNEACGYAAAAVWQGGNGLAAFQSSLQANGIAPEAYAPNEGTGFDLTRGYEYDGYSRSIFTALKSDTETYFLPIVGWNTLPVVAWERCTTTGAFISPVAVDILPFQDSLDNGTWIHVVGQGSEARIDSGANYRGVIFPFIWCVNSASDYTPNTNCPYAAPFWPISESPPSAQTAKNELADYCWAGLCNRIFTPVGTRLATVSGTSNNQLCKSAVDAGLVPGTEFVAIIYDGEVISPDPSYGGWENIGVLGWGKFMVVDLQPNSNNCNSLVAVAIGGIYSSLQEIPGPFKTREIPWDAQGGWW